MKIAIVSHPSGELHEAGLMHPEQPDRVKVIQQALKSYPFKQEVNFYEAPAADKAQLAQVHDETYVNWISSIAPKKGRIAIDEDTGMNPHTLEAALHAAGAVPFAVDLVMQNNAQVVFCNVRPPGHHAEKDKAMGFCFFNNVAVGVAHALQQPDIKRVAIIDFDVHHGNGTQNIFQNNPNVLYCSSFQHPFYPGYEPEMDNQHLLSVPLEAGTAGAEFREKVKAAWFDALVAFQPQLLFFSAGFDAHRDDPLGNLQLTCADYVWLTKEIVSLVKPYCQGRVISVLEGGYHLPALAECVPAHVNAMAS